MFCFFGLEAYAILASQPGIELGTPEFEGKVLTIGPPQVFDTQIFTATCVQSAMGESGMNRRQLSKNQTLGTEKGRPTHYWAINIEKG